MRDLDNHADSGRKLCSVKKPEQVIERIADAMQVTLDQLRDRADTQFFNRIKQEWDAGRTSLERSQFIQGRRDIKTKH